ncbi:NitT/TauT family transport system ATP-binding protein [Clostridium acidisoli DSM 12555]|uniref:ABC-type quaternary amine transporter n=1 Tax=Clostridium acidisoli DSM 12555 TaxID=1121291 RepID=A0A1W1XMT6_9CLOT|nr:ABC transporter ATP-binding protein [Clostridium acidisoli]SMC25165.1 NitT/TauT family transport system ATP-binding protein [Clostridium acidisoli DSM 12555]
MVLNKRKKINFKGEENNSEYRIKAENVSLIYKIKNEESKKRNDLIVLKDLNLNVKNGEFISIVGPSGCGKSTFLDVIAGLINKSSGKVIIDNKEINGPALDRGIVMQGYALFPWRTIQKNVEFGLEIKGVNKKERKEISKKFIDLVGLEGFENRYPHELSGGMKQRIAIARALAYDPEVLLMDEPFAAVDEQTRESLHVELLRIWEKTNKTIIFVTHSIEEAVFLSDRVAVMSKNPGTIKEIIDVNLPRPRDNGDLRSSPEFSNIRHNIWELLQCNEKQNITKFEKIAEIV